MSWAPSLLLRHHRGDARAALAILWIEAFVRQRTSAHIDEIMAPDLSEEEKIALVDLLKRTIEADHYPLSLRATRMPGFGRGALHGSLSATKSWGFLLHWCPQ
jgi:hypothetical protein